MYEQNAVQKQSGSLHASEDVNIVAATGGRAGGRAGVGLTPQKHEEDWKPMKHNRGRSAGACSLVSATNRKKQRYSLHYRSRFALF